MKYVFLSPHLDDAVLSCGAIIHYLINQGNSVKILTIFSGDPLNSDFTPFAQELHTRWQLPNNPISKRRDEDLNAANILGAKSIYLQIPDCIYRTDIEGNPVIMREEDLFQDIPPSQNYLVNEIKELISDFYSIDTSIVSPLGIGGHLDHRITVAAVNLLPSNNLLFYQDFPYINQETNQTFQINSLDDMFTEFPLSTQDINAWYKAIAAYQSQISTFWKNNESMIQEVLDFVNRGGGKKLIKMKGIKKRSTN
ncbi:MAG: hypothetical protein CVU39_20495 [Chloroflexi bacterium HGW-Chloroflexi-10]|nr:MAG: hypothetical protein CVU39_20495 [Chloroflexi bacterium HGW-Chloroflexi-10]